MVDHGDVINDLEDCPICRLRNSLCSRIVAKSLSNAARFSALLLITVILNSEFSDNIFRFLGGAPKI